MIVQELARWRTRFSISLASCLVGMAMPALCPAQPTLSVAPPQDDDSVEAERRSFELSPGYDVNLFASESLDVPCPVTVRWDERGRLWVLSVTSYPQLRPGVTPNDKLVILEDVNGDGRADSSHVFADGLSMPTGFELGYGGVFLGQGTELLFLNDTDGDERADERRIILSGFGTADAHQLINSFKWSPGGELYFCQGHHIYSRVETPWGVETLDKAGVWRLRPRRLQLAGFFNLSMAGQNQWGVSFGHWGEVFHKSNGDELYYSSAGLVKTPNARQLPAIGRVSPKGIIAEIVRSPHLPDDLQGDFLIAGYMASRIDRLRAEPSGAGYQAQVLPPLLSSSSRSFRPIDVSVGPDGAIYICDWYNPIIGHYQASLRHPDRDQKHGRIWRITARGRPVVRPPQLHDRSASQLVEYLKTREYWVRYQVRRLLAGMPKVAVIGAVDQWVEELNELEPGQPSTAPLIDGRVSVADFGFDVPHYDDVEHQLLEALAVYESHEEIRPRLLARLLRSPQAGARAFATRVIGRWHDRLEAPLELLKNSIMDPHPRVRMEAIVACSSIPSPNSIAVAAQVLDQSLDSYCEHALIQTVFATESHWRPAVSRQELTFKNPEHLAYVLRIAATPAEAEAVRRLLRSDSLRPESQREIQLLLVRIGTRHDLDEAFERVTLDERVLSELAEVWRLRKIRPTIDPTGRLRALIGGDDAGGRSAAMRLAGQWQVDGLFDSIAAVAISAGSPLNERTAAIESIARIRGTLALATLGEVAAADESTAIRGAVVTALSGIDIARAADQATKLLPQVRASAAVTRLVLPILSRRNGAAALAASISAAAIDADTARLVYRALNAIGNDDPRLVTAVRERLGLNNGAEKPYDPSYVSQLVDDARSLGNAERGGLVFQSAIANCTSCHTAENAGGRRNRFVKAPDLRAVGAGLSPELIVESIIWPSRQVKEGFMATTIVTDEGQILSGYELSQERGGIVRFRDFSASRTVALALDSIDERADRGSIMPRGYGTLFTRQEMQDLIRFLMDSRG